MGFIVIPSIYRYTLAQNNILPRSQCNIQTVSNMGRVFTKLKSPRHRAVPNRGAGHKGLYA